MKYHFFKVSINRQSLHQNCNTTIHIYTHTFDIYLKKVTLFVRSNVSGTFLFPSLSDLQFFFVFLFLAKGWNRGRWPDASMVVARDRMTAHPQYKKNKHSIFISGCTSEEEEGRVTVQRIIQ